MQYVAINGIHYELNEQKNTATVIEKGNGLYAGNIVIPSQVYFAGKTYIVSGMWHTNMESGAFSGCTSLTSVVVPNSMTKISFLSFSYCTSLTSVIIPYGVKEIGSGAFKGCSSLTSIVIPNSITKIEGGAFMGCTSLTSITIPNSVKEIEWNAFEKCTSLTSVSLPEQITEVANYLFRGCSSLTTIKIPKSVNVIGCGAFSGCSSLSSIKIPTSIKDIEDEVFERCTSLCSITIPNKVMKIGRYAFSVCKSLKSVTIPHSVRSIEDCAFNYCTSLTSIFIPNSVKEVGNYVFDGCSELNEIIIPKKQKDRFLQTGLRQFAHILFEQDNEETTILLNLAKAHQLGIGVAQNIPQAALYYSQAAEKGSAEAAYQLAEWYASGEYLMKDTSTALLYYQQAAKTLYKDAQVKAQLLQHEIEVKQQCYNDQMAAFMNDVQNQNYQSITNRQIPMKTIVFFDTECNGLPRNYKASVSDTFNWPRLIQLAWIVTDEQGNVQKRRSHIIYPQEFSIDATVANLTGISTARAQREGVNLQEVLNEFMADITKAEKLVGHNIDFDLHIVGCELYRTLGAYNTLLNKSHICTMQASTDYCAIPSNSPYGGYKWPKLDELYCKLFGRMFDNAHDALADVEATMKCYFELKKKGIL